jgi:DNA replication protein DnaC
METKTENLCNLARQLKLTGTVGAMNDLLINAQQKQISYLDFAFGLLNAEIEHRNQQNLTKRLRNAKLPADNDLGMWQENHLSGISRQQLTQLRECIWLEQNFNIILMGPSGTGKSFIAAGLCHEIQYYRPTLVGRTTPSDRSRSVPSLCNCEFLGS